TPTNAQPVLVQPRALTAPVAAGAMTISLTARIGLGLDGTNPDVLRIGTDPDHEYVTVRMVSEPRGAAPDAGAVILDRPLQRSYLKGTSVRRQANPTVVPGRQATLTLLDAPTTRDELLVADGTDYLDDEIVQVTVPNGDRYYHVIDAVAAAEPIGVELDVALIRSHAAGATIAERQPLFVVRALDTGGWGNRVLVTIADEDVGALARAEVVAATASPGPGIPSTMRLNTITGVERGTVLALRDPADQAQIGDLLKVRQVDRAANNLVVLDQPGLSPVQIAAFAASGSRPLVVQSREFRLQVLL